MSNRGDDNNNNNSILETPEGCAAALGRSYKKPFKVSEGSKRCKLVTMNEAEYQEFWNERWDLIDWSK